MNGVTLERAQAAKAKLAAVLAGRPELRGIGIAVLDCGYGVKVNLTRRPEDLTVPDDVDDVPVIIDIVGTIRAL
jgi:hypothetical protein